MPVCSNICPRFPGALIFKKKKTIFFQWEDLSITWCLIQSLLIQKKVTFKQKKKKKWMKEENRKLIGYFSSLWKSRRNYVTGE